MGGLALRRLGPFEALAEICDFVAGRVQRVPKKTNEVKFDLLNSTAYFRACGSFTQGDCSWYGFYVLNSTATLAKEKLKKKEYCLRKCKIFINFNFDALRKA